METALLTEFNFKLPRGLVDAGGVVHQTGVMRLATARDELVAHKHRQVQVYPEYLTLVLLAQVITQLGTLESLTPEALEHLFTQDLAYLRELHNRINQVGSAKMPVDCPQCHHHFETELVLSGES
ncbi:phage tail assembly protein [Phormidium sp. CLA17]|uniref:phage tail assembly protein n=1 Tax=Leptolyngbya sp. Cla-17 TaxID=2803751 RepID=UPI001492AB97|nr:phage tail assembly protein [Leptolyngbya sp. Cla-17]MBM0744554.1 phage tail assembly protein [Leptolyngbya sp. Cla-17]